MTASPMTARALVLAACVAAVATPRALLAQDAARRAAAPKPAVVNRQTEEDRALLRQLAEAQRGLGEQMQEVKEALDAVHGDLATQQDKQNELEQEVKAMREEVKGLYVESSSVKQQIDAVRDDVKDVDSNVSGFRGYSGFFLALMLLTLVVIFFLVLRR